MKNILIFGDSITWGFCPKSNKRHDISDRWPNAMAEGLQDVHIVSEGLRGRTTAFNRYSSCTETNGTAALPMLLHSHAPLDLVIIMLGSNDIYEGIELYKIRDGFERLIEIIQLHPWRLPEPCQPKIMLISPPPVTEGNNSDVTRDKVKQSEHLALEIQNVCTKKNCFFFDSSKIVRASPHDGFHLEASDSRLLGITLTSPIMSIL